MPFDETLETDQADPDKRLPSAVTDRMVAHGGEFYDGENEGEDRRNRQDYKRRPPCDEGGSSEESGAKEDSKRMKVDGNSGGDGTAK
jgi:hypothetical protein